MKLVKTTPSRDRDIRSSDEERISTFTFANIEMCEITQKIKDRISRYSSNRYNEWDAMKKVTNPNELIFSNARESVSKKRPISRSYFKLREIMIDFVLDTYCKKEIPLRTAHVAEAPGGFIECMVDMERDGMLCLERVFGLTYLVKDRKIPNWRVPRDYMEKVVLNMDTDYAGDIYDISDARQFIASVGEKAADIVTADGGFDCSEDFNFQEQNFALMMAAEIYIALHVQAPGGVFILKVFDMFTEPTIRLLSVLRRAYQVVHIVKPDTSRPANSEKYIVACKRLSVPPGMGIVDPVEKDIECLERIVIAGGFGLGMSEFHDSSVLPMDVDMLQTITEFNVYFTFRQNLNILKTIACIELDKRLVPRIPANKQEQTDAIEVLSRMRYNQIQTSTRWCETYGVATVSHMWKQTTDM